MARINLGKVVPEKGVDYYTAEEKAELKQELEQDVNARIDANAAAIATNTTNIEANADDIEALESAVATNTSNIATNTNSISTINSALTTIRQNIQTNASNIAENERDIGTLNEEQDVQDTNIQNNTNAIQGLRTDVNANIVDIDAIKSEQLTQNTNIQHNTSDIATNTTNIAANTRNIGTVTVQAQANTDEINNLKNVVIPGINQEQTTQNGRIQTNEQDIADIKSEQLIQNSNIQQNTADIATLEAKHNEEVAELQAKIEELKAKNEEQDSLIPTGDASGSDITLSDSARYKFKKIVPGGKSEQETFTGKNKFYIPNTNSRAINGVTINYNSNNSKVIVNGTATGTISDSFSIEPIVLEAGTYTASIIGLNVISTNADRIFLKNNDTSDIIVNSIKDATPQTFTLTETTNVVPVFIVASGSVYSNKEIKVQIEEGSTATEYEKYVGGQPAPNPDYECPNKNVGDNINIFDITKRLLGVIDDSGDLVIDGTTRKFYEDDFEENTQYTLSGYVKSPSGTVRFKLVYTDESSTDLVLYNNTNEYKYMTFTTPQNKTLDYISMDYGNTGKMYIKNGELKLEKGTEATPYSPYNCGNVEVKVENKNLAVINDGTFRNTQLIKAIPVKQGENITAILNFNSNYSDTLNIRIYGSNDLSNLLQTIGNVNQKNTDKIVSGISNFDGYVGITTDYGYTTISVNKLFVGKGQYTLDDYVPHEEQTAIFPLEEGQRLHKDDAIRNKIVQKRGTRVLNGSENWQSSGDGNNTYRFALAVTEFASGKEGYCNRNKWVTSGVSSDEQLVGIISSTLYFRINKAIISSLEGSNSLAKFKTWLATNNVIIETELIEPLEIPFTQAQRTAKAQIDELKTSILSLGGNV